MFPRISDLINYLFGTHLNIPVQTYGFWMAVSFIIGGYFIFLELRRKENEGLIPSHQKEIVKGAPAGIMELTWSALFGFLLGWKGIGMIQYYSSFNGNPQEFILSGKGNFPAGLLLAALFAFLSYYSKRKKQLKVPVTEEETIHPWQLTGTIVLIAAVFGILGSKIFDMIEHLGDLYRDPIGTIFSFSGLSFYGGLIVATFAVLWYANQNKIRFPHMLDVAAPALILAYALGRIGCQLAGDGFWGIVNTAPQPGWLGFLPGWTWSFNFPHNVINDGVLISQCSGSHCFMLPQPVYPTSLYETLMGLVIFGILWSFRKKIKTPGYLFSVYLVLNGIERFLIEHIRINKLYKILGIHLTQAEMIAVFLVLLGIAGFYYFRKINPRTLNK
jgi:phosphatidylglycerol---prolipoprotein diacylglyceryl transferase